MDKYAIFNITVNQFVGIKVDVVMLKGGSKNVATLPSFQSIEEANEYIKDCLPDPYEYEIIPYGILNLNNTIHSSHELTN